MENYLTISRGVIMAVALAAIFTISVATLLIIIKQAQYFSGRTRALVAVSLSILFLVALSDFLVGPEYANPKVGSEIGAKTSGHSLLPGVALGVTAAVVSSQVLILANKTTLNEKSDIITKEEASHTNKPKNTTAKSKPGRPKKIESGHSSVARKPGGKGKNEARVSTSIPETSKT